MYREQNFLLSHWPSDPGTNETCFASLTLNPGVHCGVEQLVGCYFRQPAESILAEVLAQEPNRMRSCRLSADYHLITVPDSIS